MSFHKILCPIDFSAGSSQAMRVATRLANEAGAELVLVHSSYVPPLAFAGDYMLPATVLQDVSDDAKRGLDDAVREVTALGAKRVSSKLLTGLPWTMLVAELEDDRAYDLVVIGTHGRTGLSRIVLGSVAEKIVRHAPCAVLAVRLEGADRPYSNVLCPIDFNEESKQAAHMAAAVAAPGGSITLLHVVDVPVAYSGEPAVAGFVRDLDKHASALLDTWAAELRTRTKATIITRARIGHPGAQTLHLLDEDAGFDLVVVGSHGRTGLSRVLLGSVAEKIVRHAKCPVLVARTRA